MSAITGFRCNDETEEQAKSRTLRWFATRQAVRGIGNTFVFHGSTCPYKGPSGVVINPRNSGLSSSEAERLFRKELELDRRGMLMSRAVREARDAKELSVLLAKYGVGGG